MCDQTLANAEKISAELLDAEQKARKHFETKASALEQQLQLAKQRLAFYGDRIPVPPSENLQPSLADQFEERLNAINTPGVGVRATMSACDDDDDGFDAALAALEIPTSDVYPVNGSQWSELDSQAS